MNLLHQFNQYIQQHCLFQKNDRLLIAVSGGVDSIVLCELCHLSGFDFEIAHCNFQLRGEDSEADELLVNDKAKKYKVKLHSTKFDALKYASENKTNIQIAARQLRYEWFNTIAVENNISHILTAHHANDNAETIAMNFFKGTGINGLTGMQIKSGGIGGKITRPLLFATKQNIKDFAIVKNLTWREDVSNTSDKYTRNYFRNELLPSIEKVIPHVEENLIQNIERFSDAAILYNVALDKLKSGLLFKKGNEIHIPVLKLMKTPAYKTVFYEILKPYGFVSSQMKDAIQLLSSESGKYITSATHRLIRNRNWLIVCPVVNENNSVFVIDNPDSEIEIGHQKLKIESIKAPINIEANSSIGYADADKIKFPLICRKWKQGDYFYPLGMTKKKKLSRFFVDQKLSISDKEKIWVIESDKKIIWIAGMRIDDRIKITHSTKSAIRFTLSSSE
jgi:tRNA(Ile)-lysidine synthase